MRTFLALFLVLLLTAAEPLAAQQPAAPKPAPAAPQAQPAAAPQQAAPAAPVELLQTLRLRALLGQNVFNNPELRNASEVVVEVRDMNDIPVEGATVTFELPPAGPGGYFPGQQLTKALRSNAQGQAGVSFIPNTEQGKFSIKVRATTSNRFGVMTVSQTNTARPPRQKSASKGTGGGAASRLLNWKVLAILGAGGLAGAVLATRGGGSTAAATPPTVVLAPGAITIGGPR